MTDLRALWNGPIGYVIRMGLKVALALTVLAAPFLAMHLLLEWWLGR